MHPSGGQTEGDGSFKRTHRKASAMIPLRMTRNHAYAGLTVLKMCDATLHIMSRGASRRHAG